jgi:hypothetical protein
MWAGAEAPEVVLSESRLTVDAKGSELGEIEYQREF